MKKKHLLVLQNISRNIPKELTDNLLITQKIAPSIEKVVKKFIEGKKIPKFFAERFAGRTEEIKHLYEAGVFSKTEQVADPEIEKKIDAYYKREIKKAIKMGLLPEKVETLTKKTKKYARNSK